MYIWVVNHKAIIDTIINHKPYKRYCDKLCNYRDIANDLYQEFFLIMWSKQEDELIKIYKSGGLESYCLCVIWNSNRLRHRMSPNALNNISDFGTELTNRIIEDEGYNHKIDQDFDRIMEFLEKDPYIKQDHVLVLLESINETVTSISKNSGVPLNTLKKNQKNIKDKIRENVRI